jgi:hypothetical protein
MLDTKPLHFGERACTGAVIASTVSGARPSPMACLTASMVYNDSSPSASSAAAMDPGAGCFHAGRT